MRESLAGALALVSQQQGENATVEKNSNGEATGSRWRKCPYFVRGYNMGELGAARNILELGAEIRIPVRNTHVFAFAEHGNDLGSLKDVKGNPTEVYRRMGQGSSYGVGVKLGQVRAEYAVDHNTGTGAVFFRFGERY